MEAVKRLCAKDSLLHIHTPAELSWYVYCRSVWRTAVPGLLVNTSRRLVNSHSSTALELRAARSSEASRLTLEGLPASGRQNELLAARARLNPCHHHQSNAPISRTDPVMPIRVGIYLSQPPSSHPQNARQRCSILVPLRMEKENRTLYIRINHPSTSCGQNRRSTPGVTVVSRKNEWPTLV